MLKMNSLIVFMSVTCALVGAQYTLPGPQPPYYAGEGSAVGSKMNIDFVKANSDFTCTGLQEGFYADIFSGCDFFHTCHFYVKDGNLFVQDFVTPCGEGTKFDQSAKTCDYAEKVICDENTVNSIIKEQFNAPAPAPGPSKAEPIPVTSFSCDPHQHHTGFYYADEETQCRVYHRCVYHNKEGVDYATQYSFMCPDGTLFNQKTISCLDAEKVSCVESKHYYDSQNPLHPIY